MSANESVSAHGNGSKRRAHRKSRNGCIECRRRRIKCGEELPSCSACLRHGIECRYRLSHPPAGTTKAATNGDSPRTDAGIPRRAASQRPGVGTPWPGESTFYSIPSPASGTYQSAAIFAVDDLALLHHWVRSASLSIMKGSVESVTHIWQDTLPALGFEHTFLIHAILSLSALHIAHSDPQQRKQRLHDAARHHNESLQGFRQGIENISDDTCDAIFACASINMIYVFGFFRLVHEEDSDHSPVARKQKTLDILGAGWIPMIKGVGTILLPALERVGKGPLAGLLEIGNWNEVEPDQVTLPGDQQLRDLPAAWAEDPDAEIYNKIWYMMRKSWAYSLQFRAMDDKDLEGWQVNRAWSAPLMWIHFEPNEFITRLNQRQPVALLIFSYFGAMLHGLTDYWFMEGWGRAIVEVVDELLGDYWSTWIQWPKDAVDLA